MRLMLASYKQVRNGGMSMKWCNLMNMWCSDMDEEDFANACCDGKCSGCDECEEVSDER